VIRVLVVDDSALVRKLLTAELSKQTDIEVIGSAIDPYVARDKIIRMKPDVITLDLEMPRMDGLSFLAKLMKHFPMPVVVVSSLTPQNSETALRALALGAIEVIGKPGSSATSPDLSRQLAQAVRTAAKARIKRREAPVPGPDDESATYQFGTSDTIVAIGASTGGTQALEHILTRLPGNFPGTAIVQHMPEYFTATFAARLNQICRMDVREARNGDTLTPGHNQRRPHQGRADGAPPAPERRRPFLLGRNGAA
jgi:two-component system, chemotaxis family, protein-glutamate methylesterase/glutaminase